MELLTSIAGQLSPAGIAIVVTPDVSSLAARFFGWKWWHFRVAHIGYFDRRTLEKALARAGLTPIRYRRPAWFFPADYLWVRLHRYLPKFLRFQTPEFLKNVVIPLNLRDSWLVVVHRVPGRSGSE